MKLAEVGREMQEKLRDASVIVAGTDLSAKVEALYLAGAGVGNISVHSAIIADVAAINPEVAVASSSSVVAPPLDARALSLDAAAAQVASGAFRALHQMKAIFSR
ncbi:MAG: hypothetical protein ABI461_10270 [Polyangiaceae bacterium]